MSALSPMEHLRLLKRDLALELERAEFLDRDPLLQPGAEYWRNEWWQEYHDVCREQAKLNLPTIPLPEARDLEWRALRRAAYLERQWRDGAMGGLRRVADASAAHYRAELILSKAKQTIRDQQATFEARAKQIRETKETRRDNLAALRRRNSKWRRR